MFKEYDLKLNNNLFELDYFSNYSDEELDAKIELSESIIKECGEQNVFDGWLTYLKNSVNDIRKAWSFMLWFYNYGGHEFTINNPYPFLGLLFKKLGLSFNEELFTDDDKEKFDTFDSIYVSMLIKSKIIAEEDYSYVNLYLDEKLKEAYNCNN